MIFYSDNGVDDFVSTLLPNFGYACDVGANNGVFNSNTKHFEDKGWVVLCIEPHPKLEDEGKKNRKLWRQVACGAVNKENAPYIEEFDYPWASGSGFCTHWDIRKKERKGSLYLVPMRTLDTLLAEEKFPKLDLLCIDVESYEFEVLKGIDLNVWTPKIVVVEALPIPGVSERTKQHFLSFGYRYLKTMGVDMIFEKNINR